MENTPLSVGDFVALTNQTLEYAYPSVTIMGEVAEMKVWNNKVVYFKIKDNEAAVDCSLSVYMLRQPIEDGMRVMLVAAPRVSVKGRFGLTVRAVKPLGEGSIKKGFDLLKAKLEAEGLFAPERKRALPRVPRSIAVITSTESAAYADFCKILNERWGGLSVEVAHTQVQGDVAADQMVRAIRYFNTREQLADVLVVIRGGGSAEDLLSFNDEPLARALAESRIPTLVGVGHEIDHTLADMVADRRAATPTNAAEIVVPDRREIVRTVRQQANSAGAVVIQAIDDYALRTRERLDEAYRRVQERLSDAFERLGVLRLAAGQADPEAVLRRGYAILRGELREGAMIAIETDNANIEAEVRRVREK